ncbi:endoplasmic reticulum Oxidoreductin 1-domain-containing protein [Lineolata rhizophorae]|uniref:Endoplasmic reticulum Oxidoreductin 1-domain-containing protein n=1 Tax=Lineolata rhizophorae TaxID=578093 RepID=A0A6A6NLS7_9PEZI|nr:endoplasmic reticulum Oxidoreductin 1-domain-containing protein [Lineolata rhizophorae]
MRPKAHVFYLAVFTLLRSCHASSGSSSRQSGAASSTKTRDPSPDVCAFEPGAIVSDACASYASLDALNEALHPYITSITQHTDFFSHYRLNLYHKACPFWSDDSGMCGNIACAVNTLDSEDDVPLVWRAQELGKLEGPTARHPGGHPPAGDRPLGGQLGEHVGESCVLESDDECDERDYCVPEDERASAKGDYVSLVDNPERFTGFAGEGSRQVWEAIYRENCFSKQPSAAADAQGMSGLSDARGPLGGAALNDFQAQAAQDLRNVMHSQRVQAGIQSAIAAGTPLSPAAAAAVDTLELDDGCIEKRVFHRVVSGMHASISTHLCYEHLNQTTGQWGPNLACYEKRLRGFPERVANMYFNYALVARAVGKLRRHVRDYEFCSADPAQDALTKRLVLSLAEAIPPGADIFDESVMFRSGDAVGLKDDFRSRFRNVSRIMDCVGCDKCRLWGKLQTAGYGTALKVLFEFDEEDSSRDPPLRRTELVALVNTFGRISHSLKAVKEFERLIAERDGEARGGAAAATAAAAATGLPGDESGGMAKSGGTVDDGLPEDFPRRRKKKPGEGQSFMEAFWEEWNLVWRTFGYVLRSWVELPGKFWRIAVVETSRLWDFWLGLPPRPRSWEWRVPGREEL